VTTRLAGLALALAFAPLAAPATAAPCDSQTLPQCVKPVIDRYGQELKDVRDAYVCPLGVC
jgi:hypothetical protein